MEKAQRAAMPFLNKGLFLILVSFVIVAMGRLRRGHPFLAVVASCIGYSLFWRAVRNKTSAIFPLTHLV